MVGYCHLSRFGAFVRKEKFPHFILFVVLFLFIRFRTNGLVSSVVLVFSLSNWKVKLLEKTHLVRMSGTSLLILLLLTTVLSCSDSSLLVSHPVDTRGCGIYTRFGQSVLGTLTKFEEEILVRFNGFYSHNKN